MSRIVSTVHMYLEDWGYTVDLLDVIEAVTDVLEQLLVAWTRSHRAVDQQATRQLLQRIIPNNRTDPMTVRRHRDNVVSTVTRFFINLLRFAKFTRVTDYRIVYPNMYIRGY